MTPSPCQSRSKSDRTGAPLGGRPLSAKRTLGTTQMGGNRTVVPAPSRPRLAMNCGTCIVRLTDHRRVYGQSGDDRRSGQSRATPCSYSVGVFRPHWHPYRGLFRPAGWLALATVQCNLRSDDRERIFRAGCLCGACRQKPHSTRQFPLVCSDLEFHARPRNAVSRTT